METGENQTQGDRDHARELAAAAGTARTLIGYSLEGASEAMGISQVILQ